MTEYCVVTTSIDSADGAQALARAAVTVRLAACAQVTGPVRSTYWWQGAVDDATEWVVTLKTTTTRYPELERFLRDEHPYEVAEIVATPIVAGSPAYLAWIAAETIRTTR
ncbi:divalent-cation tolerance protein CutA [Luedemannella helvata]|uniref:Divalent-cation tolerance protein CutA n=1 Tax=Luedemannella helvata TaxID=349315 RepID=A0ABN2K3I4_9ACTN